MAIFLALFPENATEVHVRWDGHSSVESATKEIGEIRSMMLKENRIPMDCYVYEADKPPFNLPIHAIDDVDFNFYRERTPEEIKASQERADAAFKLVERTKDTVNRAEELAMAIKEKVNKMAESKEKKDASI